MRSITAKLIVGMTISVIGLFAADSTLGTWKLNPAKSKSTMTNPVKSQLDVRELTPDGMVKTTRKAVLADGTALNYSFSVKYDGKPYPVTGAPFDTVTVKRTGPNTTEFTTSKTGGKFHTAGKTVISDDGKTMTQTAEGADATGKAFTHTMIFDKQ